MCILFFSFFCVNAVQFLCVSRFCFCVLSGVVYVSVSVSVYVSVSVSVCLCLSVCVCVCLCLCLCVLSLLLVFRGKILGLVKRRTFTEPFAKDVVIDHQRRLGD